MEQTNLFFSIFCLLSRGLCGGGGKGGRLTRLGKQYTLIQTVKQLLTGTVWVVHTFARKIDPFSILVAVSPSVSLGIKARVHC